MAEVTDTSKAALRVGTSMLCFLFRGVKNVTAKMLQFAIREYLKKSRELKHGEQPISKLTKHGSKLESIEITDQNIKAFERIAKRYSIDFSLEKDRFSKEPVHYVFFKSHDVEIMQRALIEYAHLKLHEREKAAAPEQAPEPDLAQSLDKDITNAPEQKPGAVHGLDKSDKPAAPKEAKMDLRAELEQCKAEAAEQMKELAKGHGREIAREITMEPDR